MVNQLTVNRCYSMRSYTNRIEIRDKKTIIVRILSVHLSY